MSVSKLLGSAAAALLLVGTAANASTIVNLSANSVLPNAGSNSGGFVYNPIVVVFDAGTYTVNVVGISGGGLYDAYSVYSPSASNMAYTDGNWSVNVNGVAQTVDSVERFNTAGEALAYYGSLSKTFTLATAGQVSFYIDDTNQPYFSDDAGGVSLVVNAVPEPLSMAVLGAGVVGLGLMRRHRKAASAG